MIKYTVKIKVREYGQAKGIAYTPKICASLEESLKEIADFVAHSNCPVQEYYDIRIKSEEVKE